MRLCVQHRTKTKIEEMAHVRIQIRTHSLSLSVSVLGRVGDVGSSRPNVCVAVCDHIALALCLSALSSFVGAGARV